MLTLDEIAAGAGLGSLTRDDLAKVLCRHRIRTIARHSGAPTRTGHHQGDGQGDDHLIDADAAAARLGVKKTWLYRRTKTLPFAVHLGGKVLFSSAGIDKYIAARRGR